MKVTAPVPQEIVLARQQAATELATVDIERLQMAAGGYACNTTADYEHGGELLKAVATATGTVEEFWGPKISAAFQVHKLMIGLAKPARVALEKARKAIELKMGIWKRAEEERARRQQAQLQEAAEAARRQAEQEAADLAGRGYMKEAKQMVETARTTLVAPTVVPNVPKLEGASAREPWEAEVTDLEAFIKAVADGRVPLYHEVIVQGKLHKLPVLDVNLTVCKRRAAEMNGLDWPGVSAQKGIGFTVRR